MVIIPTAMEEQFKRIQEQVAKIKGGVEQLTSDQIAKEPGIIPDLTNAPILGDGAKTAQQNIAPILATQAQLTQDIAKLQQTQYQPSTETQGLMDKLKGFITQRGAYAPPSMEELLAKTYEKYGLTEATFQQQQSLISQMGTINQQMANIDTQEMRQLEAISQQPMGMFQITGHQAALKRQVAIERAGLSAQANALAVQSNALQGQITQAQNIASQVVEAKTYDIRQTISDMEWEVSTYSDLFSMMDKQERDDWQNTYNLKVDELKTRKADLEQVMGLMIQYPDAGITTEDSPAEAATKAAIVVPTKAPEVIGSAETGYLQWNPKTKAWESIPGMGGLIDGMTKTQQDNLTAYISDVQTAGSREEALKDAELNKTTITLMTGATGYEKVLAEIDKIFPPAVPKEKKPSVVPTAVEAGGVVRGKVGKVYGKVEEVLAPVGKAIYGVGGFFKGLFGG